jgi:hypothetical protein
VSDDQLRRLGRDLMNPKYVIAVSLAAISAVVVCGCNKPETSSPAEKAKQSEKPDAVETAIRQQASSDAFAAVKATHSSAVATVVQDNFRIEDVKVAKLTDGYSMMCTAFYEAVFNNRPHAGLSCSDHVVLFYDSDGKRTDKYKSIVKNVSRKDVQRK